jgi:hypothetical protein
MKKGMAVLCLSALFARGTPAQQSGKGTPTFTTIDAPGAGTGSGQGTFGVAVNTAGTIAGSYNLGTLPCSINAAGVVAGHYDDPNGARHGFLRAANGAITEFDAPGSGTGFAQGINDCSINSVGVIAG